MCGVDQVVGVVVGAPPGVTDRGLPGPGGGGHHVAGQQLIIISHHLRVAGEFARPRPAAAGILLKVTEIFKHSRLLRIGAVMDRLVVMSDGSEYIGIFL